MTFTDAQKKAIETRNKTLIVSAGAGSGKTSVLTERIIRRITDKDNPCDITDFLVVTFTKASANDLKNKIAKAINKSLSKDSGNIHLKRQQLMLGRANISTIHSFYLELVQSNFEKLGLPAKFRLADSNEISVIRKRILDNLLEEYYNSKSEIYKTVDFTCRDFVAAVENFISHRDDSNIYNVILKIYEKINSHVNKYSIFENQIAMSEEIELADVNRDGFFSMAFGKTLRFLFEKKLKACLTELDELLERTGRDPTLSKKYTPSFSNKFDFLVKLARLVNRDCSYGAVYDLCENYEKVSVGRHKLDEDLKIFFNGRNEKITKKIKEIMKYFEYKFDDVQRFAKSYKSIITIMYDFIKRFDLCLLNEKIRLKVLEFADLEHFAFDLLIESADGDGVLQVTDFAKQLKLKYKEIYIDEYQDTNKLQDTIFRAISTEIPSDYTGGSRFMVGDVKQSIYAFRGAKSHIFSFYSKLFQEDSQANHPQKIYLKDNFRSSYNIISFVNCIFGQLFSDELGGIDYTGGEVLSCGRVFVDAESDKNSVDTTFALIDKDDPNDTDESETGGEDDSEIESAEAEYVALTIKKLITHGRLKNGERIFPRDIAILMRSATESDVFMDALKRHDIPCYTDKTKGFLESAEILLMISLLKTIDNPHADIPLASVLKSPIFSFTLDDLIYLKNFHETDKINEIGKKEYLYYYVKSFADIETENGGNFDDSIVTLREKCRYFLDKLRLWRMKSRTMTVDKFVWYIYRQTDIFARIAGNGFSEERRGNLLLLHEYARQFEATSFNGLYGFLNYIDDVKSGRDDFEKAKILSENSDVVRIMSIHKSKGLEFPVCILSCTGKKFNTGDYTNDPIISETDGIYFNLRCDDGIGFEKTIFKKAAADKIKAEMRSEEARILYVALTRAIEKLIVTGSVKNIGSFLMKYTSDDGKKRDEFKHELLLSDAECPLKWLVPIILNSNGKNRTDIGINVELINRATLDKMTDTDNTDETEGSLIDTGTEKMTDHELAAVAEYEKKIRNMYDYSYPQKFLAKIPAKMSVSSLHPGILDNDEYVRRTDEFTLMPIPRFLEDAAVSAEPSDNPALTGTAMHLFMQFADFENAEKFGAAAESENLTRRGFISNVQSSRLNFKHLDKFFSSGIYKKIKSAKNVYRETRFTIKIPASDLSASGEIKRSDECMLIQGVIDLFFIDENGDIFVVDFKTDYVKKDGGEKILVERHKQQINYYCDAVEKILNRPAKGAFIYSFALDTEIKV